MKTIKNIESGEIKRVENKESYLRVGFGWEFVPKSVWKEYRKTNVVVTEDSTEDTPKRTKASKKNDEKKLRKNKQRGNS